MAFTRPSNDLCAYNKHLHESTSALTYILDPDRYYNCNECRIAFGVVGGNEVSRLKGNLVDLESDLRNLTRVYSHCPEKKYLPKCNLPCRSKDGLPCGPTSCHSERYYHLPTCNMIQYKPRAQNTGIDLRYPPCSQMSGLSCQKVPVTPPVAQELKRVKSASYF